MSGTVWISDVTDRVEHMYWSDVFNVEPGLDHDEKMKLLTWQRERGAMVREGRLLSSDRLPDSLYKRSYLDRDFTRAAFFKAGYHIVTEPMKQVLEGFDLGESLFHPVPVFEMDKVTPTGDEPWFVFNIGSRKSAFLPDQTVAKGTRSMMGNRMTWDRFEDDGVAVTAAALEGADLWIDTGVSKKLFVSYGLAAALTEAGHADLFDFKRCKIVEG